MTRETRQLRIAYLGNWRHAWTTENEYRDAFERHGHQVVTFQEGEPQRLVDLCDDLRAREPYDFVLWTRTPPLAEINGDLQWRLLLEANRVGVPVVGVHLDRWWGLEREWMIAKHPYFRVDLLCTADGAHADQWADAGIMHRWLPPGISERWCKPGSFRENLATDVLFVGSWKRYHDAWDHRVEMVNRLSAMYQKRFAVAPKHGQQRVTMLDLNDYYWSAKVVVGDSCLVPTPDGKPITNYCSDRVPETLGRGGILLHPRVEGINSKMGDPFFPSCNTWELGDWRSMGKEIDRLIARDDGEREKARLLNIDDMLAGHTYTVRVGQLIDILREENIL